MKAPLVSAIVLTHESERYIAAAIESIRAQTHPNIELVVVDNGSTDRTREIVLECEPDLTVWVSENRGICPGRNMGLAAATGDYLAFLDSDDMWTPEKTEHQLAALGADPEADYVLGGVEQFLSDDADPALAERLRIGSPARRGQMTGALLASREVWKRVGPWAEELQTGDGLDWFLRADRLELRETPFPETVLRRRIHGQNSSLKAANGRNQWARMLKDRIDERRAAQGRP